MDRFYFHIWVLTYIECDYTLIYIGTWYKRLNKKKLLLLFDGILSPKKLNFLDLNERWFRILYKGTGIQENPIKTYNCH